MLERPRNLICPSVIFNARSNTLRQLRGLRNGRTPSSTSSSARAPSSRSQNDETGASGTATTYFLAAGVPAAAELPRIALKNSLLGSTTIRSFLLRKLDR